MTTATRSLAKTTATRQISPSKVSSVSPFTLDQELEPFGTWSSDPIWVPPQGISEQFAKSMLSRHGLLSSKCACWSDIGCDDRRHVCSTADGLRSRIRC